MEVMAAKACDFAIRKMVSIIGLRCRQRNSNFRINRLCQNRGLPEVSALSVDPRVGISQSALETGG